MRNIAAASAGALLLMGATAMGANAYYLGYGNGDTTNMDFWAEQHANADTGISAAPSHPAHVRHASVGGCGALHHRAEQTGSGYWWHRYHECERG